MKKLLALLLASLMVVALFAGCSKKAEETSKEEASQGETSKEEASEEEAPAEEGGEEEAPAEEGGEEEAPATEGRTLGDNGVYYGGYPSVDEPVTISVCHERAAQTLEEDENNKWAVKNATETTGIALEWNNLASGTSGEQIPIMLAGGDLPDVFFELMSNSYILQYEEDFVPIEGWRDTYAANICRIMEQIDIWEKEAVTPSGHVYSGLRFYESLEDNSMNGIQIMNTTWLKNVGIDELPTDWDSYYAALEAFRDQDANGNGDATDEIPYGWADGMWCAHLFANESGRFDIGTFDSDYFEISTDGVVSCSRNTDRYKEYLQVVHQWYEDGLIDKEGFTDGWDELGNKVKNDKVGTYYSWTALEYMGTEQAANWDTIDRIGYPGHEGIQNGVKDLLTARHPGWVITTNCKIPEAACAYWDYLQSDPDLSIAMSYGEEGKLWGKYEDGSRYWIIPEATEDMNYENMKYSYGFVNGCPLVLKKDMPVYDEEISPGSSLREQMVYQVKDKALEQTQCMAPASYIPAEAAQEYSLYNSDIESAINQFHGGAVVSGFEDAEWDAYVAQLDTLGLADYIEYNQHRYDADF